MKKWKAIAVGLACAGLMFQLTARSALANEISINGSELMLIELGKKIEKLEQDVRVLRFMSDIELEVVGTLCKVVGTQSKKVHLGIASTERDARQKALLACMQHEPGAQSRFGSALCPVQSVKCIEGISNLDGEPVGIR